MTGPLQTFRNDEDGAIFALFAVMLAAFLGLVALSFDFGRMAATQSELQSYADNVALAAAGELDGGADAITRATSAAATFIADVQSFGDGDTVLSGVTDFELTFYDSRADATAGTNAITQPLRARFVRADIADRRVAGVFAPAFRAMSGRATGRETVGAKAVAGYTLYACNTMPLTFCAPTPAFSADLNIGSSVNLQASVNTGALVSGSLAMVEGLVPLVDADGVCALLSGLSLDLCLLAGRGDTSACLATDGISIADGNKGLTIKAGLDVRLNIFEGLASTLESNPLYSTVDNLLGGVNPLDIGKQCTQTGNDPVIFPQDNCQPSCGILGNADWSTGRAQLVAQYYKGVDPFPAATTRFEFYQAMISASATASTGGLLGGLLGGLGGALGLPNCTPTVDSDPNRRVIVAAAIDCTSVNVSAGAQNVPVLEFVELFLTAPTGQTGTNAVNVEIVGSLGGGDRGQPSVTDTTVRDVVRLYN